MKPYERERRLRRLAPRIQTLEASAAAARSAALRARLKALSDEDLQALTIVAEAVKEGETIADAIAAVSDDDRRRLASLGVTA